MLILGRFREHVVLRIGRGLVARRQTVLIPRRFREHVVLRIGRGLVARRQTVLLLRRFWVPLVFVLALAVAGCGSEESEESVLDEIFVEPTAEPDLLPTEEDLRDRFEGTVTEPFDLLVGTCFNQYTYLDRNDLPAQLTTAIGCTRPHNGQVYAVVVYEAPPDTPYPGEDAVNRWGQDQCYERFKPFVGLAYELSQLDIGMITPSRTDWEGEDDLRRISCFVHSYRGLLIVGTMEDIAL